MISSRSNATVKSTVRLRKRREREKRGVFVVEGHRATAVAAALGARLLEVFHTATAARRRHALLQSMSGAKIHAVTPEIMAYLTGSPHPPDVIAITPMRPVPASRAARGDLILVLAGVKDPAVAGGLLAAGAAAGAAGAIGLRGTTDLFAPPCVRAGAGAHFALPLAVDVEPEDADAALAGHRIVALSDGGVPVCSENMRPPIAVVIGEGPLPEAFSRAERVCVPAGPSGVMAGPVARAAVALYEARRP